MIDITGKSPEEIEKIREQKIDEFTAVDKHFSEASIEKHKIGMEILKLRGKEKEYQMELSRAGQLKRELMNEIEVLKSAYFRVARGR